MPTSNRSRIKRICLAVSVLLEAHTGAGCWLLPCGCLASASPPASFAYLTDRPTDLSLATVGWLVGCCDSSAAHGLERRHGKPRMMDATRWTASVNGRPFCALVPPIVRRGRHHEATTTTTQVAGPGGRPPPRKPCVVLVVGCTGARVNTTTAPCSCLQSGPNTPLCPSI